MNHQSISFSELQSRATKGPYTVHKEQWERSRLFNIFGHINPETQVCVCSTPDQPSYAHYDAELIRRLLNFAHAGGAETLRSVLDKLERLLAEDDDHKKLRADLAILNGEAKS